MRAGWLLPLCWLAVPAAASNLELFPATQVNSLDNAGGGARALALGSAYVAVADDSSAPLWNPAGLARLTQTEIGLHHNAWLAGITQDDLALAVRTQSHGTWALSQDYVDEGSYDGRDANGALTTGFSANRIGLGLGWGGYVGSGLDLGFNLHESRQTLANFDYDSLSGSFGLLYRPMALLQIGLDYNALGNSSSGDPLAAGFRAGASLSLPGASWHSLLAVGADLEPAGVDRLHFGGELGFGPAALRAGYDLAFQDDDLGGLNGLTLGGGLALGPVSVDYAYLPFGQLGVSQRISVQYAFNAANSAPEAPKPPPKPVATPQPTPQASATPSPVPSPAAGSTEPVFAVLSDGGRLGQALEARGDTISAAQAYHAALALDPQDTPSWRALAHLYVRSGRADDAAECFQGLLRASPGDEEAVEWLRGRP
jgi:tetratricopeptide (TPR) repeat protein